MGSAGAMGKKRFFGHPLGINYVRATQAAEAEAAEQAAAQTSKKEKKIHRKARGRGSTILTSGLGVAGQASVSRKTLLGQ